MTHKFRVLHVNTERTWRGGEQQMMYLVSGLRRRGHEAEVACQPGSPLAERAQAEGAPTFEIKMRGEADPIAITRLRKTIRRGHYDFLHMHTSHAHTLGCLAAAVSRRSAIRVVARRVDFSIRKHLTSILKYQWGVDRYIAISQRVRNVLVEDGVAPEKISIVHSGIDLARFENAEPKDLRAEFGLAPETFVVGNIAHFADHKGQQYLVAAVPLVLAERPDTKFFLVGEGELGEALKAQTRELGVTDNVIFTGFRTDIPQLLEFFDLFVMSSHMEGLCTSLLDAMAMRKPIVATYAGGIPEIVTNEHNGLLVPPRNPSALAEAILALIDDRDKARTLAENGRTVVEQEFSANAMVEKTIKVYEELYRQRTGEDEPTSWES